MIGKYAFLERMAPDLRQISVEDRKRLVDDARVKTFSKWPLLSVITIILVPALVFLALTVLPIVLMRDFSIQNINYYGLGFIFLSIVVINLSNQLLLAITILPAVESILNGRVVSNAINLRETPKK